MDGKFLGKIVDAQFGRKHQNGSSLIGLHLEFRFDECSGVNDGGRHLIDVGDSYRWNSEEEKNFAYQKLLKGIDKILTDAKVSYVSQLIGMPIEIEIEGQMYKSFRILSEVL